jgi:hypothetical protein
VIRGGASGSVGARAAARDLRKAASRSLTREIRGAVVDSVKPLQPMLVVSASGYMPRGYGPTLAADMRMKTTTVLAVSRGVRVSVTIFARGKKELRDVAALNRGMLRHPLFGNRGHWYAQRVKSGFVDDPVARLRPMIVKKVDDAASRVAVEVEKGL